MSDLQGKPKQIPEMYRYDNELSRFEIGFALFIIIDVALCLIFGLMK